MKSFSYTNQYGATCYLHLVRGTNGRTYYKMRATPNGAALPLPQGYEVRESVQGHVSVRRMRPQYFTVLEEKLLHTAMENIRPYAYRLDLDGKAATIYASAEDRKCFLESLDAEFAQGFADALNSTLAKRYTPELVEMFRANRKKRTARRPRYYPLLRFVLADKTRRSFAVERVCFTGESTWLRLEVLPLTAAVMKYLPHLGKYTFFDLI